MKRPFLGARHPARKPKTFFKRHRYIAQLLGAALILYSFLHGTELRDKMKDAASATDSELLDFRLRMNLLFIRQQIRELKPAAKTYPIRPLLEIAQKLVATSQMVGATTQFNLSPKSIELRQRLIKRRNDDQTAYDEVILLLKPKLTDGEFQQLDQTIRSLSEREFDSSVTAIHQIDTSPDREDKIVDGVELSQKVNSVLRGEAMNKAESEAIEHLKQKREVAKGRYERFERWSWWLYLVGFGLGVVGKVAGIKAETGGD